MACLMSCQKEEIDIQNGNQIGQETDNNFPFVKVGNQWVYDFVYQGKVYDSLTRKITGLNADVYEGFLIDKEATLTEYLFIDGNNLMYYTEEGTKEEASILTRWNVKEGEKWLKLQDGDTSEVEVMAVNKTVVCPAGDFECTELKITNLATGDVSKTTISDMFGVITMAFEYQSQPILYTLRTKNF